LGRSSFPADEAVLPPCRCPPFSRELKGNEMTDYEIEQLAHRTCWRYKVSTDPNHSDTYTFNRHTLLEFARALVQGLKKPCRSPFHLDEPSTKQ